MVRNNFIPESYSFFKSHSTLMQLYSALLKSTVEAKARHFGADISYFSTRGSERFSYEFTARIENKINHPKTPDSKGISAT